MKKLTAAVLAPVIALLLGAPASAAEPKAGRLDINSASAEQIKATLGVSDDAAEKIIAARPYHKKDDLKTKGVLPAESAEKLLKLIDSVC
jgi:DNA uptake protein ComE-like DNA-binding protein